MFIHKPAELENDENPWHEGPPSIPKSTKLENSKQKKTQEKKRKQKRNIVTNSYKKNKRRVSKKNFKKSSKRVEKKTKKLRIPKKAEKKTGKSFKSSSRQVRPKTPQSTIRKHANNRDKATHHQKSSRASNGPSMETKLHLFGQFQVFRDKNRNFFTSLVYGTRGSSTSLKFTENNMPRVLQTIFDELENR